MNATLDAAAADPHQTIAELRQQLDACRAELAARNSEFGESIEHQSATIDVLKAMSASPGDPQPVFDLIVRRAQDLCNTPTASLFEFDGELVHRRSLVGREAYGKPEALEAYERLFPMAPTRGSITCRAILDRQIVHVRDIATVPRVSAAVRSVGYKSQIALPLLRDGAAIGAVTLTSGEIGGFSDSQVALLQAFAEQAVIAITSAATYRELQQRTGELALSEAELRGSEERYALVSRAVAEGIYDWDIAQNRLWVSPRLIELFGWEAGEGIGERPSQDWNDQVHPEDFEIYRGALRAALKGATARLHCEYRIRLSNDEYRWIEDHALPVRDERGWAVRLVGAVSDVADRKQREQELREALEQQTATAEVLQVINASPGDLAPVFDAMLEKAMRLCEAAFGGLAIFDGDTYRVVATHNIPEPLAAVFQGTLPIRPETSFGRIARGETPVHIADVSADETYRMGSPVRRALVDLAGARSALWVALRKDDAVLGTFVVWRQEVRPFSDKQIALLDNFAAQAVIAIENARLLTETREALDRQTATAEILRVISSSPTDVQPTFDAIAAAAKTLTGAVLGGVLTYDGARLDIAASSGWTEEEFANARSVFPIPADRGTTTGRAIVTRAVAHIEDVATDPEFTYAPLANMGGHTSLAVPMLRDGEAIGAILVQRRRVERFSDKQIDLLKTFADQAVIAIENVRLFNELSERTGDLQESLEYQTATSDVLKVIGRSSFDIQPVFETIAATAGRLCDADTAVIRNREGEAYRVAATFSVSPGYDAFMRGRLLLASRGSLAGRTVLEGRIVHVHDVASDPEYTVTEAVTLGKARTVLGVPLLREGVVVGTIALGRQRVQPFTERQIELVRTFADQAVIALENARLLGELQQRTDELAARNSEFGERIEHQSATIDVLKAMSASPGDPQPVFDLIVRSARDLCNTTSAGLFEFDGELVHLRSTVGREAYGTPEAVEAYTRLFPMAPTRDSLTCRAILDRQTIHVRDMATAPGVSAAVRNVGHKSQISLPLLRDGAAIGAMSLSSLETGGFSDSQVALLQTFAEQAVIAITSAETYRELRQRTDDLQESLEYQTATSDVLKVISRSTADVQPVLDTVTETAGGADTGAMLMREGEVYRYVSLSTRAAEPGFWAIVRQRTFVPGSDSITGRVALEGKVVHVADILADPDYAVPEAVAAGRRTQLGVPLLREGAVIGTINLGRKRVEPFTERQIELVRTFADQAVIAIENARLLGELQARTDELTRSVAELQALEEVARAVNSSLDLDTVLATVIGRAVLLSQADEGMIYEFDEAEEVFVPKSAFGMSAERVEALRERRIKLGETHLGRSAIERAPVYVADVQQDPSVPHAARTLPGIHAVLAVPLLREDKVVGGLVIRRRSETGFAPTIATLMQTFAAQSVLAIENARLFQELAARGEEARRAHAAAENALADLRRAQARLIQAEKMASLGQLTAGIAHEIKNPLNFVNNFAGLSVELLDELKETAAPAVAQLGDDTRAEIDELVGMLTGNLEKIAEHGRRADGIVKSMLEHSRGGSGERRDVDLNGLVEEALNLAYHGARAQDQNFNITLEREFAPHMAPIELVPQDVTRVLLNLIGNGFYAAIKRDKEGGDPKFKPTLKVATHDLGGAVEIRVRDNGAGVPPEIKDKLFQPFFTTKPTGEGTGLGLSISWDIVTQQHGGTIAVDSRPDEFTEFAIRLPRTRLARTA